MNNNIIYVKDLKELSPELRLKLEQFEKEHGRQPFTEMYVNEQKTKVKIFYPELNEELILPALDISKVAQ